MALALWERQSPPSPFELSPSKQNLTASNNLVCSVLTAKYRDRSRSHVHRLQLLRRFSLWYSGIIYHGERGGQGDV
jgi:hypothetical protein